MIRFILLRWSTSELPISFDSSMMNGLQAVNSWDTCESSPLTGNSRIHLFPLVYHSPRSTLLGLMSAIYSAGAIIALPFVPVITDGLGRRRSIAFGSIIMIIGATLQTASQNCQSNPYCAVPTTHFKLSCDVCCCEVYLGIRDPLCHCCGIFSNWRFAYLFLRHKLYN